MRFWVQIAVFPFIDHYAESQQTFLRDKRLHLKGRRVKPSKKSAHDVVLNKIELFIAVGLTGISVSEKPAAYRFNKKNSSKFPLKV
jgi:hypothetical protein